VEKRIEMWGKADCKMCQSTGVNMAGRPESIVRENAIISSTIAIILAHS